jgi:hypothetical protein
MQALKVIKALLTVSPKSFPSSFGRSLVAIGCQKDDNLRRVCLETLRELLVLNPEIVVRVNGMNCLLEAIVEPTTHDMAESILVSFIYLLNDQNSRYIQFIRINKAPQFQWFVGAFLARF